MLCGEMSIFPSYSGQLGRREKIFRDRDNVDDDLCFLPTVVPLQTLRETHHCTMSMIKVGFGKLSRSKFRINGCITPVECVALFIIVSLLYIDVVGIVSHQAGKLGDSKT